MAKKNISQTLLKLISALAIIFNSLQTSLYAGEEHSLWEKFDNSSLVIEVEFQFPTMTIQEKKLWLKKPFLLSQSQLTKIRATAKIVNVLKQTNGSANDTTNNANSLPKDFTLPSNIIILPSNSLCWRKIAARRKFRVIYFFANTLQPIVGTEVSYGHFCSTNPNYGSLVSAISTVASWQKNAPNQLIKGVGEQQLFKDEEKILNQENQKSKNLKNNYVRYLASNFLKKYKPTKSNTPVITIPDPTTTENICK